MVTRGLLVVTAICQLIVTVGVMLCPTELLSLGVDGHLSADPSDIAEAGLDFGRTARAEPLAVLHPASAADVVTLVKAAYGFGFPVSARGHGHSLNGQAQAANGVVIDMSGRWLRVADERRRVAVEERYVDVWGGELWIDVLNATLAYGLAPRSWTDYLYLSVGGTLSNGGISGQTFNHGPQITNVLQLDVVTGKGDLVTCSEEENTELFHGVLGGLGQFGIITRARIALEPAPHRVRWIRVLYTNFSTFTRDQEYLISLHGTEEEEEDSGKFEYVEGFVMADEGLVNNWRSSFLSPQNPVNISSLAAAAPVFYCLEIAKNYFRSSPDAALDQEIEALMKKLEFIPGSVFTTDVSYEDFLDRVHKAELKLRSKGLWEVPHPWLNLFVPRSRIADFNDGVFKGILGNNTSGPILIYPMNRNKWDDLMSTVTPDEDVFYLVALLRSALNGDDRTQTLEYLTEQNSQILKFCRDTAAAGSSAVGSAGHGRLCPGPWAVADSEFQEWGPYHIYPLGVRDMGGCAHHLQHWNLIVNSENGVPIIFTDKRERERASPAFKRIIMFFQFEAIQ
ncbi:hypothetical protein Nepgr_025238 [Nepenthes gracilis]|uniref:cytokinin dehydrogenase n=1 Tax=Nepenthes gracilis TaxID=150966 RepID=A0AAD3T5G7_NEPGR|nr:hypothetical protein Nepgr_025238 [Nepenthes gracilis]